MTDGPAESSPTTIFELKNTSAEPLNITAEELLQRFVRGDRSRGETEGHGLGLSIARDLASLMGGSLRLDIDGDLFKAIVTLPNHEAYIAKGTYNKKPESFKRSSRAYLRFGSR